MNQQSRLVSLLRELSELPASHSLRYQYGLVRSIDTKTHSCRIALEAYKGLELDIPLLLEKEQDEASFHTPAVGSRVLLLCEGPQLSHARLLEVATYEQQQLAAEKQIRLQSSDAAQLNLKAADNNKPASAQLEAESLQLHAHSGHIAIKNDRESLKDLLETLTDHCLKLATALNTATAYGAPIVVTDPTAQPATLITTLQTLKQRHALLLKE